MKLAILCPGQGAQHSAMLELVAGHPDAEDVLAEGAQAVGAHVRDWLAQPLLIHDNAIAQPLLCLIEFATWAALRGALPQPVSFAGYSVGELASHACAGGIAAGELARLAQRRAAFMDAANPRPGGLLALRGLLRSDVEALCAGRSAWIAIANGNDAFVVGGDSTILDSLSAQAVARGGQVTCLKVGVASHTPWLAKAVRSFQQALDASTLHAPVIPVIAGVDASLVTSRAKAISALAAQLATTIEWSRCLEALYERGCRVFLELGPGDQLSRMVRELLPSDVDARSVSNFRSLEGAAEWVTRH